MTTPTLPRLLAHGHEVETKSEYFGELRRSIDMVDDPGALRERMREDGYLYLPGYLDAGRCFTARREVTDRLAADGLLDPDYPAMEAVAGTDPPRGKRGVRNDIARTSPAVQRVLYERPDDGLPPPLPERRRAALRLHLAARHHAGPGGGAPLRHRLHGPGDAEPLHGVDTAGRHFVSDGRPD